MQLPSRWENEERVDVRTQGRRDIYRVAEDVKDENSPLVLATGRL